MLPWLQALRRCLSLFLLHKKPFVAVEAVRSKMVQVKTSFFTAKNTYSVFCTKCLRLQNVVLPYCSHISLISNYQHWNFGITAKVSL